MKKTQNSKGLFGFSGIANDLPRKVPLNFEHPIFVTSLEFRLEFQEMFGEKKSQTKWT